MVAFLIGISSVLFGATAVLGLWWAAKSGQFERMDKGAETIFDKEECVGEVTGLFPDMTSQDVKPGWHWKKGGK